ncbi:hypothetical protein EI94DRAFT_962080 [Lactarius quietus]|nr:hypothetical protein EI94DRAFT_962080 [Lactarius quietus]
MAQAQVQVIIVGGGLSDLSAVHALLVRGANVDKPVSWTETRPKPLQASTALALKFSTITTSQTRR